MELVISLIFAGWLFQATCDEYVPENPIVEYSKEEPRTEIPSSEAEAAIIEMQEYLKTQ